MWQRSWPLALWRCNRALPLTAAALLLLNGILLLGQRQWLDPRMEARRVEFVQLQRARHVERGEQQPGGQWVRGKNDLARFNAIIPPKEGLADFVGDLFQCASQAGLGITRITYEPDAKAEDGLLRYRLSFALEGGYAQLKRFVYLLEQAPRLVVIEQLTLTRPDDRQTSATKSVRMQLRFATYFREGSA